jgi:hypothetical protein
MAEFARWHLGFCDNSVKKIGPESGTSLPLGRAAHIDGRAVLMRIRIAAIVTFLQHAAMIAANRRYLERSNASPATC